jgi:hypothetical protein
MKKKGPVTTPVFPRVGGKHDGVRIVRMDADMLLQYYNSIPIQFTVSQLHKRTYCRNTSMYVQMRVSAECPHTQSTHPRRQRV